MAKLAEFQIGAKTKFSAELVKLEREKAYGYSKIEYFDSKGKPVTKGSLLEDGKTIIGNGSTSLLLVDPDGKIWKRSELEAYLPNGKKKAIVPSVFEAPVKLEPAEPTDVLNTKIKSVYILSIPEKEDEVKKALGEKIFQFEFNYRADYEGDAAFILANSEGIFLLTGEPYKFTFLEKDTAIVLTDEDEAEETEEIDFSMF